jgi:hypothetical protein
MIGVQYDGNNGFSNRKICVCFGINCEGGDFFNYNLINVSSVGKLDRNEESCVS